MFGIISKIGGAAISAVGIVAGIIRLLGLRTSLRVDLFLLGVLIIFVTYCVVMISARRRATGSGHWADVVAVGLAATLATVCWYDVSSPPASGWPRPWATATAFVGLVLIAAWATWFARAPRISIELFKTIPFPLAETSALAFLVCVLTVSIPLQLATTALVVGTHGDHGALTEPGTGDTGTGNKDGTGGTGDTGTGDTSTGSTSTGTTSTSTSSTSTSSTSTGGTSTGGTSTGGTSNGGTGGGSASSNPCGDNAPFGLNSSSPDLKKSFYELIQADDGPGEKVAGCPKLVHHLHGDRNVEYEFGFDSAGDKASLAIVSPTTRAVFLYPAVAVAWRLMHQFGAIGTSGAQCAGNGSWVLIYDPQGTEALIRANINDQFTDLKPPAFYALLAAIKAHDDEWLWPVRRPSPYPGVERFDLVHDTVTNDVVDTIYYDTRAARSSRVVDGAPIYYYNALGTKISPSFLESISPKTKNCVGLNQTSNLPAVP